MTENLSTVITLDAAAANLTRGRFCTGSGAVPAAGALVIGVIHEDVDAGDPVPVGVKGMAVCESGNTITLTNGMAKVEVDNQGRVVPATTGEVVGIAIDAATGSGQYVRVILS